MAVPQQLFQQLLELDQSVQLEIAHALLDHVDRRIDEEMSDDERDRLNAALDRSIAQCKAGQTVPFDEVMAALHAKRAKHTAR